MFIQKDIESEEKSLTTIAKLLIAAFTVISMVVGTVLYFENTYMHKADAKELILNQGKALEKSAVQTFQMQQKLIDTKQQYLDQKYDMERVTDLRDHEIFLEEELKNDPTNTLLKHRLNIIKNKLKKLEDKIYGQ